jgi:hypothetical protein
MPCVWPAWRSVGSSSGHTVGGMCMQPAGVATGEMTTVRHAGVRKGERRSLNGRKVQQQ